MVAPSTPELSHSDSKEAPQTTDGGVATDGDTDFGVDERKLVRKLDWHLVPLIMLLCECRLVLFTPVS